MSSGVTINGAESKLRSFFRGVEGDFVATKTIFENEGRDPDNLSDRNWFYNYNSILKKYGLANPLKGGKDGVSVTLGLTLTDKGREVIRKSTPTQTTWVMDSWSNPTPQKSEVTLASWRADGLTLQEKHPELVIEFDVRLRKEGE